MADPKIVLARTEFRDKVYACWLGKNIGGTLGAPYETRKEVQKLTFYDPVPKEPAANDDLDLQLVWLQMLEERGLPPRLPHFAEYWKKHLYAYPWNEYGFCSRNLDRGLLPPVSGWFENYYVDEMGSPIRSEIWACLAPADPQRAASFAWMDSAMDHAGGEGMNGEMFWAAVESAAFVTKDPYELIEIGLNMIPPSCSIARVIREAAWCRKNGKEWLEARERINATFGHAQPCNAIPNHGFIILGWLYGEDFGDRLCKAVNCGYDTDCTGATLGSLLGILGGTAGIPEKWSDPVGKTITLHKFTKTDKAPKTIEELTDRTVAVAERHAKELSERVSFGEKTAVPAGVRSRLLRNDEAFRALAQDIRSGVAIDDGLEIVLNYGGGPVLAPGVERVVRVSCRGDRGGAVARVNLRVPDGWTVTAPPVQVHVPASSQPADAARIAAIVSEAGKGSDPRESLTDPDRPATYVVTPGEFSGSAVLAVTADTGSKVHSAEFTVFAPDASPGYPAATNIEYCPACHGRKGSCVCEHPGQRQGSPRQLQ